MFIKPRHALLPISLSGIFKDGLGINMTMKTFFTLHITSCEKNSMVVYICKVTGAETEYPLAGLPISLVHGGYSLWPRRRSRETALYYSQSHDGI